ncbi:hypothetical protein RZ77_08370 [Apilactobacillus kunkeei]|uniref:hypothetical protein n=1 Tax=Apilactobacillus kunkeei TaxID=148814 RepID=UPI0006CE7A9D|nr:hypothetical protein [Apilactobacillus kunkeei]KPN83174.1 hypothetical protein RZ77_08370 [Apilactobacillus kunkeei]
MKKQKFISVLFLMTIIFSLNFIRANASNKTNIIKNEFSKIIDVPSYLRGNRYGNKDGIKMYYQGYKDKIVFGLDNSNQKIPSSVYYLKKVTKISRNKYMIKFNQLNLYTKQYITNTLSYIENKGNKLIISNNKNFSQSLVFSNLSRVPVTYKIKKSGYVYKDVNIKKVKSKSAKRYFGNAVLTAKKSVTVKRHGKKLVYKYVITKKGKSGYVYVGKLKQVSTKSIKNVTKKKTAKKQKETHSVKPGKTMKKRSKK